MALMTENNIPYVIFGHPAPAVGVVGSPVTGLPVGSPVTGLPVGSPVTGLPVGSVGSVGSVFLVVCSDESVGASLLVVVSGAFSVTEVVGAAVTLVVGASVGGSVGADDTILATEISPTRTKTKVFLLQTILLFGNVVSSF